MNEGDEIIAKMMAGEASADEVRRVTEAAKSDEVLHGRLSDQVNLDGLLSIALEDEFSRERRRLKILEAVKNADREEFVEAVQGRVKQGRWMKRGIALAAMLVLCGTAWFLMNRQTVTGPGSSGMVATISRLETVTWGTGRTLAAGSGLKAGESLKFDSGLVELEVGERGKMIVEGPAELNFAAADRSVLTRGRVVMRVNEAGHGYRVETSQGSIVDLGTEFGVSVGDDGRVETHVLEGKVEAYPKGGAKVLLEKDDALRLGNGGEHITADGGEFYTALPPLRGTAANSVHWNLDEGQGMTAAAVERGSIAPGSKAFNLRRVGAGDFPKWTAGVFGQALSFDGKGAYAESDFRGIGGSQSRTVCFWVKVPKDLAPRESFAILSWGRFQNPGEVWQIAINPLAADGELGRIRVGTHLGQIVGTADLRDDKWHHVAVVLYGGSQVNVGTHVLVYLDGKLEPISRRALREIRTEVDRARHGVWLGRDITYDETHPGNQQGRFFRGSIDEPSIFDEALSQPDIQRLIEKNTF